MNTNQLKKFAQEARRKLLQQVGAKLEYVLTHDTSELREKAQQIKSLKDELIRIGKEQLVEKVAYTWFNRLMALRFMDANDYQPSGIRIVSPQDGYTLPQILDEAKQGHFPEEILKVDRQKVLDLLDGRIPSSNPQNEAFRTLLIGACNALHKQFSFLFERINDYTELLLPDDLTSEFSVVQDIQDGMSSDDCQEVEIIGWLYQFYISEKKDEIFASKSKVKKEDIPAATQLFTPRWIVEYMVQNTLGKLWLQNKPNSRLREHMPYFLESPSMQSGDYLKVASVEEITLLDQACGSGHILVYTFELLTKIYEEEGYNPSDIPKLIIEKNLYGFEIDERAAQLSGLSLLMKARRYYRRLFRNELEPNILCFKDVRFEADELALYLKQMKLDIFNQDLQADIQLFEQATNLGSLMQMQTKDIPMVQKALPPSDIFFAETHEKVYAVLRQMKLLNQKFHCVVDNPPYMGGGKMNKDLGDWVKVNYPKSKADLMVCFMERSQSQIHEYGYVGMINLPSWMFISSFEEYRKELIESFGIDTLLHIGRGIFGSDFGTVAFTFIKNEKEKPNGVYRRLFKEHVQVRSSEKIRTLFLDKHYGYFEANQKDFEKIPRSPIGYWLNKKIIESFNNSNLESLGKVRQGFQTGNNPRFIKLWFEIGLNKMKIDAKTKEEVWYSNKKFVPYNKGGAFRKWYGNNDYVVAFDQENYDILQESGNNLPSRDLYFKPGVTWTDVTSGSMAARVSPSGFTFSSTGACAFPPEPLLNIVIGLLNSKVSAELLKVLAPSLHFSVGDID